MKITPVNLYLKVEAEDLDDLKTLAKEMRVPYTVLARMILVKGIKDEMKKVRE